MYYHTEAVWSYLILLLIRCLLFTLKCPRKPPACCLRSLSSKGGVNSVISSPGRDNKIWVLLCFEEKEGKAQVKKGNSRGAETKQDS